ncbi:MAG: LacI family DNA-binding transcriptional regulator [Verrucomicrobiota bacterium]
MSELAKLAGVSRTTVSRALNDAPEVSATTRDRVTRLAKKHGYQANPMVTALMTDVRRRNVQTKRSIIAIAYPTFQDRKWGEGHLANRLYRTGAERRARELGYKLEDFPPELYGGSYKRLSQILYQRGIQAVLVPSIDVKSPPEDISYELDWDRFAAAGVGFSINNPRNLDRAVVAHFQSVKMALGRIRELGYTRIGFGLCKRISLRTEGRWLAAYLFDQVNSGGDAPMPPFEFEEGGRNKSRLRDWLRSNQPEVILGDGIFLDLLKEVGVDIPGKIAFALLDWFPGDFRRADYAGVDQRFESVGAAAIDLIAGRVNHNERGLNEEQHVLKVSGRWVDGASLPRKA